MIRPPFGQSWSMNAPDNSTSEQGGERVVHQVMDRRGVGKTVRRVAIAVDITVVIAVIGFSFWVGQQSKIIEDQGSRIAAQGESIKELSDTVRSIPETFVATRSIDDYIDRRVQSVFSTVRSELQTLSAEQARTKNEVRANYELSMQTRMRDLQREACNLTGSARKTLETEIQDLLNRYANLTGRDHRVPPCDRLQ